MNAEERVISRLTPEDLSIVTIDGDRWLGCFNEEGYKIEDGYNFGSKAIINIEQWFLCWNIETLTILKLSKMISYTARKLRPEEIEEFKRVQVKMLRAKKYALNYWENQVYREHM